MVDFPKGIIGNPAADSERLRLNATMVYQHKDHRLRFSLGGTDTELAASESKNFGPGVLDQANFSTVSEQVVDVSDTPYVYLPNYQRKHWFLSVQDEWRFADNWELTAGLRYDNFDDFGSTTNPRVALVWKTNTKLTTKFLYGSAFRAPSVQELAVQNNPVALGNSNLKPETIDTVELAFDYQPSHDLNLLANIYSYRANNLITLIPDPNIAGEVRNQNALRQQGYGLEVEVKQKVSSNFSINLYYTWQRSEDSESKIEKAMVPSQTAYIDLRYRINDKLTASWQSYWVAGQKREFCDIGKPAFNEQGLDCENTIARANIADYSLSDATLIYQADSHWQASVNVKNLFNKHYKAPTSSTSLFLLGLGYPNDIPMPGRELTASVEYRF